ncbi:CMGC kinase, Dyrk family, putative [Eimeria maxima]|uniref:CMGC kinase, Dyrk family, putative n=1 Tax=Eimeria maxima TaxID=5804 RepID=U6M4C7_EIMMA|nr:CMGC kinase, Dyrk family, putative [Eimeria maxima]CDJ58886.1 CMGC kinase, Dyrk family, putative [Eimeria maxima]
MEYKGKLPNKLIRSGQFSSNHFNSDFDFIYRDKDSFSKQDIHRIIHDLRPTKNITESLLDKQSGLTGTPAKINFLRRKMRQFGDLLEKCLTLDPQKRLTPDEALQHPFVKESMHFVEGGGGGGGSSSSSATAITAAAATATAATAATVAATISSKKDKEMEEGGR